jgi:hypothetical protein
LNPLVTMLSKRLSDSAIFLVAPDSEAKAVRDVEKPPIERGLVREASAGAEV